MKNSVTVAVDAMGGDNAPDEIVQGAVEAVNSSEDVNVLLTGIPERVKEQLDKYTYPEERLTLIPALEVIETGEPPVMAIRRKKDSSIVVGMNLVKEGRADAFVSAGSSGAILVGGQVIVGRLKGVERPPLAPVIPTSAGPALLVDCGANVDARPDHLVQFAKMGSIYMQYVIGVDRPRVALLNIGTEEEKGNALVKETYPLLKGCPDINFTGSIEARDITRGAADVIVCEAFAGNIALKMFEGTGLTMIEMIKKALMSSTRSKLGALLIKPALREVMKTFDISEYGGAPLLGLKGLVVKTHGSSKHKEVRNSIIQCAAFKEQRISEKIGEMLSGKD